MQIVSVVQNVFVMQIVSIVQIKHVVQMECVLQIMYVVIRSEKIICVFLVTSVKKIGSVGRKMFLFWNLKKILIGYWLTESIKPINLISGFHRWFS